MNIFQASLTGHRAPASLGVVLEECGFLEWNGRQVRIKWHLIDSASLKRTKWEDDLRPIERYLKIKSLSTNCGTHKVDGTSVVIFG